MQKGAMYLHPSRSNFAFISSSGCSASHCSALRPRGQPAPRILASAAELLELAAAVPEPVAAVPEPAPLSTRPTCRSRRFAGERSISQPFQHRRS